MVTSEWISAIQALALELFGELEFGGVLINGYFDKDQMLLVFVDRSGPSEPPLRDNPLLWLNKEVMEIEFPLVIDDAFVHPLCQRIRRQIGYQIGAYVGAPIRTQDDRTIGSVGAVHPHSHRWSDYEISRVRRIALLVSP